MIIVKSVLFIFAGICVPWILGAIICDDRSSHVKKWIYGWLLLFGVFEIIALVAYYCGWSADFLTAVFLTTLTAVAVFICLIGHKKIEISVKLPDKWHWRKEYVIILIALLLILVQMIAVAIFLHTDDDDAFYVGTAAVTYFTNTINYLSPYTGEVMNLAEVGDYLLSPLPVLWGILARLLIIHPAYLTHTVLPILLIPMSYAVYWLLGEEIFTSDKRKQWLFLGFVALINLFGGFSVRSTSSFLLFRIWQGKAILCNVMIPLYFYFFLRKEKGDTSREWYMGLWLLTLASCLVSFTGILINLVLLGIYWLVCLLRKEQRIILGKIGVTGVPYVVLGLIYALIIR